MNLSDLQPEFRKKIEQLIIICSERNVKIIPYMTIRNVWAQAVLWRQSRSKVEIEKKIADLKINGNNFLAYVIRNVGPHTGPRVTDAIPGASWHQYGLAVDCYVEEGNKAIFDKNHNGYKIYREEGLKLGLFIGPEWDWCHLQGKKGTPYYYNEILIEFRMLLKEIKILGDLHKIE